MSDPLVQRLRIWYILIVTIPIVRRSAAQAFLGGKISDQSGSSPHIAG